MLTDVTRNGILHYAQMIYGNGELVATGPGNSKAV
jgi:hypothetical protein